MASHLGSPAFDSCGDASLDVPRIKIVGLRGWTTTSNSPPSDSPGAKDAMVKRALTDAFKFEAASRGRPRIRAESYAFSDVFPLFTFMILFLVAALHAWSFVPAEGFVSKANDCKAIGDNDVGWPLRVNPSGWVTPLRDFLLIGPVSPPSSKNFRPSTRNPPFTFLPSAEWHL